MKTCAKCGETKTTAEFYKDPGKRDGVGSYCKQCKKVAAEKWRSENLCKSRAIKTKWRTNNPEKAKAASTKYRADNLETPGAFK